MFTLLVISPCFQMGLGSNGSPFGAQSYGQGAAGPGQQLNPQQQLQNKSAHANSLPPFSNELKGAAVTSVPNMVSTFCTFRYYCTQNALFIYFIFSIKIPSFTNTTLEL